MNLTVKTQLHAMLLQLVTPVHHRCVQATDSASVPVGKSSVDVTLATTAITVQAGDSLISAFVFITILLLCNLRVLYDNSSEFKTSLQAAKLVSLCVQKTILLHEAEHKKYWIISAASKRKRLCWAVGVAFFDKQMNIKVFFRA